MRHLTLLARVVYSKIDKCLSNVTHLRSYLRCQPRSGERFMAAKTNEKWVHLNGTLVPRSEAHLSIYDHGFLYGDGAFEGIRVYNRCIFRLKDHLTRLM